MRITDEMVARLAVALDANEIEVWCKAGETDATLRRVLEYALAAAPEPDGMGFGGMDGAARSAIKQQARIAELEAYAVELEKLVSPADARRAYKRLPESLRCSDYERAKGGER